MFKEKTNRSTLYDECTTEDDGGFFDVMMFVTVFVSARRSGIIQFGEGKKSYLSVPTPPASRMSAVSVSGCPTQRIAKALRI